MELWNVHERGGNWPKMFERETRSCLSSVPVSFFCVFFSFSKNQKNCRHEKMNAGKQIHLLIGAHKTGNSGTDNFFGMANMESFQPNGGHWNFPFSLYPRIALDFDPLPRSHWFTIHISWIVRISVEGFRRIPISRTSRVVHFTTPKLWSGRVSRPKYWQRSLSQFHGLFCKSSLITHCAKPFC